jgi:tetratricopeptide (TPR) repeat protein
MPLPDIRDAATMIDEGRIEPARTLLQNILHSAPSHLSARVLLARILESEGNLDGALLMWKQAALYGPGVRLIEEGLREALLKQRFGDPVPMEPLPEDHPVQERPREAAPAAVSSTTEAASPPQFQDLDRLITELETASIVPDPDVPLLPSEALESDIEDVVSETLARIYANQGYFEESAAVYGKLAEQHPERKEEFLERSAEMREKAG